MMLAGGWCRCVGRTAAGARGAHHGVNPGVHGGAGHPGAKTEPSGIPGVQTALRPCRGEAQAPGQLAPRARREGQPHLHPLATTVLIQWWKIRNTGLNGVKTLNLYRFELCQFQI